MKISTHSSNPDISTSASAVVWAVNHLGMCNPVSCKYATQQVGISTSSSYNYSHCFQRWVGPDYYLLPLQLSLDIFVLGYRVELLRFAPFLGWAKFIAQNSQTKSGHILAVTYSTHCFCSVNTFNRLFNQFRIPQSHSLPFNILKWV